MTKENPLQPTPPYPLSWTPVTAAAAIGRGEYAYSISELAPSLVNVSCSGDKAAVEEKDRYKLKQL